MFSLHEQAAGIIIQVLQPALQLPLALMRMARRRPAAQVVETRGDRLVFHGGCVFLTLLLGVLIVFISCARGAFASVSPVKLLLAMLLWAFATLMIAESAEGD